MTQVRPDLRPRIASVDPYRGLVLDLMMGEALHFCAVAAAKPASAVWSFVCFDRPCGPRGTPGPRPAYTWL